MLDLNELTARLRTALLVNPAAEGSFKFVIQELGTIYVDKHGVTNIDQPAQCTMTMTREDLRAVLEGELDPRTALVSGRLALDGDVAIAQALQPALAQAWLLG